MLAWRTTVVERGQLPPEVEVSLEGTADLDTSDALRVHLAELRELLVREQVTQVRFDLRELSFLNSSSVKELITFVDALRAVRGVGCQVQFAGDKRHAWQRRTLRVLRLVQPDLVSFEIG